MLTDKQIDRITRTIAREMVDMLGEENLKQLSQSVQSDTDCCGGDDLIGPGKDGYNSWLDKYPYEEDDKLLKDQEREKLEEEYPIITGFIDHWSKQGFKQETTPDDKGMDEDLFNDLCDSIEEAGDHSHGEEVATKEWKVRSSNDTFMSDIAEPWMKRKRKAKEAAERFMDNNPDALSELAEKESNGDTLWDHLKGNEHVGTYEEIDPFSTISDGLARANQETKEELEIVDDVLRDLTLTLKDLSSVKARVFLMDELRSIVQDYIPYLLNNDQPLKQYAKEEGLLEQYEASVTTRYVVVVNHRIWGPYVDDGFESEDEAGERVYQILEENSDYIDGAKVQELEIEVTA